MLKNKRLLFLLVLLVTLGSVNAYAQNAKNNSPATSSYLFFIYF